MDKENQEKDILLQVRLLHKAVSRDFDNRLSEYGVTGQQGSALFFISWQNKIGNVVHQNDIEKKLKLTKSTVSGLISRMEKNNLIIRESSPPFINLKVTENGQNIIDAVFARKTESIEKVFKGINEEERKMISNYFDIMINNLKEDESDVEEHKTDTEKR